MIRIKIAKYEDFKTKIVSNSLKHFSYTESGRYHAIAIDGPLYYTHAVAASNKEDYEEALLPTANQKIGDAVVVSPFAAKGKNHFRGKGVKATIPAGDTKPIDYQVPAGNTFRFNGIEVLNGDYGDLVQLQVIDTEQGTYTEALMGTAVPNYVLDQFGDTWNMRKELIKVLPYEATLQQLMRVRVLYTNNQTESKDVYVNLDLHLIQ